MTTSQPTGQVLSLRCAAQKHASRPQGRIATVPHCCLQQPAGHLSSKQHLLSPHRVTSPAQPQPSRFAHQPAPGPTANGSPARATASPRPWLRPRPATHGFSSSTVSLTSSLPHACSPRTPPPAPPPRARVTRAGKSHGPALCETRMRFLNRERRTFRDRCICSLQKTLCGCLLAPFLVCAVASRPVDAHRRRQRARAENRHRSSSSSRPRNTEKCQADSRASVDA